MKILALRLENLNSLYGEWCIDFTDPEYVSNGIFALTGPTGAGKSTILDAICLALYGSTPRLGKITKSGNEIMSRQTGECYAEVVFESQSKRYRCKWAQRRSRKLPSGKLQDQEHEISDADTGKLIETKKSLVVGVIEDKTGMDFDRFTRSILLAQGGFDTFLKANIEQKSKILEQITGTEIYSEISRRVHERHRDEREKLNLLQAETAGIMILEPEQEKRIQEELKASQKEAKTLEDETIQTSEAITWFNTMDNLKKEIEHLLDEKYKWLIKVEDFKPKQKKLEQAKKTVSLAGEYATLLALRKQQNDEQTILNAEKYEFPKLEKLVNNQTKSLETAEELTLKTKKELKAVAPLIQKIRLLDQKIIDQAKMISENDEHCAEEKNKIEDDKKTRLEKQRKRAKFQKTQEIAEQYLKVHSQDEWLISGLAGIEEQVSNLLVKQKEIAQKKADFKCADKALTKVSDKLVAINNQCNLRKQEVKDSEKNLQQSKDALKELLTDTLLREYRSEKESLQKEKVYLARIASLEDHRSKLEKDKPCPLCGSILHPFSAGDVPIPDEIEQKIESLTQLISKAEALEETIKKRGKNRNCNSELSS